MLKVAKFGGSSLADAAQFRKVASIIKGDSAIRFVVASAPGKRSSEDIKITDMLLTCHRLAGEHKPFDQTFGTLCDRFREIIADLSLSLSLDADFDALYRQLTEGCTVSFVASRGEYFGSKILAAYMGFEFIDAAEVIRFTDNDTPDAEVTNRLLSERLSSKNRYVIPGFYGSRADGTVTVFSRGGSDVTGSLVARAVGADIYENWTDVSGLMMADPRVIDNPKIISYVTYRELRELSYMGAAVLHEDAIFPVKSAGIPINIRNTNAPADPGTMIVPEATETAGQITGIAGKKGFCAIYIEKDMMNSIVGFARKVLTILEDHGICFEHLPSGIDTMTVLVEQSIIAGRENELLREIQAAVNPDKLHLVSDLCLIAVVGRGMIRAHGTAAKLFAALAENDINIRMIDQGSSELNIIVGLENHDYETAIQAIYNKFVSKGETE